MPSLKRKVGDFGEKIACDYLRKKGYSVIETNYLKTFGEIDIVAKNKGNLVFVEVKTRIKNATREQLPPEANVNYWKGKKIIKTAQVYLIENSIPENIFWQIDVISVELDYTDKKARIKHFENAVAE